MQKGTPPAEVETGEAQVRALLEAQHPDLAQLPLTAMEAGWDNAMYRLGAAMILRLPRRAVAAELVRNELKWLPVLAPTLPLKVPVPLRRGRPGQGYRWHWSVLPWIDGVPGDVEAPGPAEAARFAEFLKALHRPAPGDAPDNPFRGGPLEGRRAQAEERLARLSGMGRLPAGVAAAWEAALAARRAGESVWIHGDIHARNVIVADRRLAAVVDWGDLTSGDAACDLAGIWHLFETPEARRAALEGYGAEPAQVARAMGWAVHTAAIHLATGLVDHPVHARIGAATLERVAADRRAGLAAG